jgi:hypothetical protein
METSCYNLCGQNEGAITDSDIWRDWIDKRHVLLVLDDSFQPRRR